MKHFLKYWKHYGFALEFGQPLRFAPSNQLVRRNVAAGDTLWLVTLIEKRLTLLGRLEIGSLHSKRSAAQILGRPLHSATEYAFACPGTEMLGIEIDLGPLASQLCFLSRSSGPQLAPLSLGDRRTVEWVRELKDGSARLLEHLIASHHARGLFCINREYH